MRYVTQAIALLICTVIGVACQEHKTTFIEVSTRDQQSAIGSLELGVSALVRGGGSLSVRLYVSLDPSAISPLSLSADTSDGGASGGGESGGGESGGGASFDISVCEPVSRWVINGRGQRPGERSSLSPTPPAESPAGEVADPSADSSSDSSSDSSPRGTEDETPPCVYLELTRGEGDSLTGAHFDGLLSVSPAPIGLSFAYRLRASGESGIAWWPSAEPIIATVEGLRAPLTLTHIAPRSGPSIGGAQALIKGSGFSDQAPISATLGGRALTDLRVESPRLISARLPPGAPGTRGTLVVTSAGREATLLEAYTWEHPPRIDRVTPSETPALETAELLIRGAHFVTGDPSTLIFELPSELELERLSPRELSELTRGLEPLSAQVLDAEHIKLTLPIGVEGEARLIALNPDGQPSLGSVTRREPPIIRAITPSSGPDSVPTWVALEGTRLRLPATVWFDGRRALEVEVSADGTRARVKTPLHPGGLSDVVWYNPDGQSSTLESSYRFLSPPRALEASPRVISRCGGGVTTLTGVNLSAEMRVYFNGVEGEVLSVNEEGTEAVVRAPALSDESGEIELELIGVDGRRDRRSDIIEYGVQPLIRSVEPPRAPVWGGTSALIRGADLVVDSTFSVNGRAVERARFLSAGCDSVVEVILPEGDEGLQALSATLNGEVTSSLSEAITYVKPTLDPPEGLNVGYTNVVMRGLDLREGMRISFNGVPPRSATRISDEEWRLITPSVDVGAAELEVRNVDGRGLIADDLYRALWFVDQGAESLSASGECNHVAQGDLNGDGFTDLILAMGASSPVGLINQPDLIYFGDASGGLSGPRDLYIDGNGMNAYLADFDEDDDLDVLLVNLFSERNFLLLNDGQANFVEDPRFPSATLGPSYDAGVFDADADGDLDIFFTQTGDVSDNQIFGPERLYLREGDQWVDRSGAIDFDLDDVHDHDMAYGDLNNDGLDDVVIVVDNLPQSFPGASNRILLNRGDGRFERIGSLVNNFPGDWLDVVIVDITGDGNLDILMPQDYIEGISVVGTPAIAVFVGDGEGGFTDESFRINGLSPVPAFGVTPADLDGDGDLDLSLAVYGISFGDGSVDPFESALLMNDGSGQFFGGSRAFNESRLISSSHFEVIDIDRDGRVDMVECAADGQSRVWLQQQE